MSITRIQLTTNGLRLYVNDRKAGDLIQRLWNGITFPLADNAIDADLLDELMIIRAAELSPKGLYTATICSLDSFSSFDLQILANDTRAQNIVNGYFNEWDLPLEDNRLSPEEIGEILETIDLGGLTQPFADLPIIELPAPYQRQDSDPLSPSNVRVVQGIIDLLYPDVLPVMANNSWKFVSSSILSGLGDLCPLSYKCSDLPPLQVWLGRPREDDDPVELTIRLFDLILSRDILPYIPFEIDPAIDDYLADAIILRLLRDRVSLRAVTQLSILDLTSVERGDVPVMITPERLVMEILYGIVLPQIPLTSGRNHGNIGRVMVYEIVVNEWGGPEDSDSDESPDIDDERSPYVMTDKYAKRSARRFAAERVTPVKQRSRVSEEEEDFAHLSLSSVHDDE
jgi:hypothetical protein